MIPAEVGYVRAATNEEAFQALADPDARVIAGGHSLVPMMKLRLATPALLVDIADLDFRGVTESSSDVRIGSLTTYDELLRSKPVSRCSIRAISMAWAITRCCWPKPSRESATSSSYR